MHFDFKDKIVCHEESYSEKCGILQLSHEQIRLCFTYYLFINLFIAVLMAQESLILLCIYLTAQGHTQPCCHLVTVTDDAKEMLQRQIFSVLKLGWFSLRTERFKEQ